jgi:hypothetical protein
VSPLQLERAATVRDRIEDALAELQALRCSDHAAATAIHAVKLTEQTLGCWWLPLLDRTVELGERSTP